jgi:hypothetical protein
LPRGIVTFRPNSSDHRGISPTAVQWWQYNGSQPEMLIFAGSTFYRGTVIGPSGCDIGVTANVIDNLKQWQALVTSAILAGKNLRIDFGNCSGGPSGAGRYIRSVELVR